MTTDLDRIRTHLGIVIDAASAWHDRAFDERCDHDEFCHCDAEAQSSAAIRSVSEELPVLLDELQSHRERETPPDQGGSMPKLTTTQRLCRARTALNKAARELAVIDVDNDLAETALALIYHCVADAHQGTDKLISALRRTPSKTPQ